MITFKQKGDFSAFNRYTERLKEVVKLGDLNKYGRQGVDALKKATPRDTGETAGEVGVEDDREVADAKV